MMVGRSFTHSLSYRWSESWERLDGDGNSNWQTVRFDTSFGRLCATLSSSGDRLGLWDFSLRPLLVNILSVPVVANANRCGCLEWSHLNDRVAITLVSRAKLSSRVTFQQFSDLVVIDIAAERVVFHTRLPFVSMCISFLPTSSDHLLVSSADIGAYCLVDCMQQSIRILGFNGFQASESYQLPSFSNENGCYVLKDTGCEQLAFWASMFAHLLNSTAKVPSSFSPLLNDTSKNEFAVVMNGQDGCVAREVVKIDISVSEDKTVTLRICNCCVLPGFSDLVWMIRTNPVNKYLFISAASNAVVLQVDDWRLEWEQAVAIQSSALAAAEISEIDNIGGGFLSSLAYTRPTLAISFVAKEADFRLYKRLYIFDFTNPSNSPEVYPIPKTVDLNHIESCFSTPLFVGIRSTASGDEASVLGLQIFSDFAGAMYPSGFKVMKGVKSYTEREDELDKIVLNRKMVPSEPSSGNNDDDTHLDIDISSPVVNYIGPRKRLLNTPFNDLSLKLTKKVKAEGSSTSPSVDSSSGSERISLVHLVPVPRSVKTGQFSSKVIKSKVMSKEIERVRLTKHIVGDKISMFERLRKEERLRKIEKEEKSRIAKEEKLKQKALQRAQLLLEKEKQDSVAFAVTGASTVENDELLDMSLDAGVEDDARNDDSLSVGPGLYADSAAAAGVITDVTEFGNGTS